MLKGKLHAPREIMEQLESEFDRSTESFLELLELVEIEDAYYEEEDDEFAYMGLCDITGYCSSSCKYYGSGCEE